MDISLTSPAMVAAERSAQGFAISNVYFSTGVIKTANQNENAWLFKSKLSKKTEEFRMLRLSFLYSKIITAIMYERPQFVAIEDYAQMGKGAAFYVVELTGMIKLWLWKRGIPFRLYDPQAIKLFATGRGDAKKEQMIEAAENAIDDPGNDLSRYGKSDQDVADAFHTTSLLHRELCARENPNIVLGLSDQIKRVFNRVTMSNPVNILARDFIKKA